MPSAEPRVLWTSEDGDWRAVTGNQGPGPEGYVFLQFKEGPGFLWRRAHEAPIWVADELAQALVAATADVASLTEENAKFRALGCNGAKVDNFDAAMAENAKLRADRDRLQRERDALRRQLQRVSNLAEARLDDEDWKLGRLLREAREAWPGYRLKFYGNGQIEFDPFPNVSTTAPCVGFTEADDASALRAALQAAPTGGAAPLKEGG
jgi:hypothetical protein